MIGSGHPARFKALHPFHPDLNVLQRVIERVAEMKCTGDIWRWDNNRIRLLVWVGLGMKEAIGFPEIVDARLSRFKVKSIWD